MATCVGVSNEPAINTVDAIASDVEAPTEVPHSIAEIVIIRHGETTWNASGKIQGQLDSELNELGWKQAAAIAERLGKELKPTAVYSSDLKRAKNTAEVIAKKCQIPEVIEIPELKERHMGILQGLVWSEIQDKEPEAFRSFSSSEHDIEIPGGGESFNQSCQRSVAALEEIASRHMGERVIVVTHGGIIRAIYMSVTNESSAGDVLNGSISVLHLSTKKWVFKSWSDVSHLNGISFLQRGSNGDSLQL